MTKTASILALLAASMLCGCVHQDISINTSYSWEKRYTSKDKISINSEAIDTDGQQVWILTSTTLYNLLTTANGKDITIKESK